MPNLIPFPSQKRNRPDAPTLNIPMLPDEVELLLMSKHELLVSATNYLEALCRSLRHDTGAMPHHPMNADGRSVQTA
ncbi:hypothetical protein GGD50_004165 [Rhizobium paranaense]|uniref:Uncharacterized protein n=1 Tax=Rhizobium paranaense TaxID=1650438 RepID=A0A7W8XTX0_9HYPH|nr:hypothetical protein [Rhizobium paranaense]